MGLTCMFSAETNSPPPDPDAAVTAFVAALAACDTGPNVCNFYATSALCRHNVSVYLAALRRQGPGWLLVGEAPGYRGCRLTGVPFTSEDVVLRASVPGRPAVAATARPRPQREATATMVWQVLSRLGVSPVLWNAFPFHPFRPNQPASNRRPTAAELAVGQPFLHTLLELFPGVQLVAVGRSAERALARLEQPYATVRHPSHGGKRAFAAGLHRLICRPQSR